MRLHICKMQINVTIKQNVQLYDFSMSKLQSFGSKLSAYCINMQRESAK